MSTDVLGLRPVPRRTLLSSASAHRWLGLALYLLAIAVVGGAWVHYVLPGLIDGYTLYD